MKERKKDICFDKKMQYTNHRRKKRNDRIRLNDDDQK